MADDTGEISTLHAVNSHLTQQAQIMAETLRVVAMDSDEGHMVRIAFIALLQTDVGTTLLQQAGA